MEFALVLPVFAMLVVGLFSSAMIYDSKMSVTHASREGARYGATVPEDQDFSSDATWAESVAALVRQRGGGALADAEICVALVRGNPAVAVSPSHSTESGSAPCYDDSATGEDEVRVQVAASKSRSLDVVLFSRDVNVSATASSRHESHG